MRSPHRELYGVENRSSGGRRCAKPAEEIHFMPVRTGYISFFSAIKKRSRRRIALSSSLEVNRLLSLDPEAKENDHSSYRGISFFSSASLSSSSSTDGPVFLRGHYHHHYLAFSHFCVSVTFCWLCFSSFFLVRLALLSSPSSQVSEDKRGKCIINSARDHFLFSFPIGLWPNPPLLGTTVPSSCDCALPFSH